MSTAATAGGAWGVALGTVVLVSAFALLLWQRRRVGCERGRWCANGLGPPRGPCDLLCNLAVSLACTACCESLCDWAWGVGRAEGGGTQGQGAAESLKALFEGARMEWAGDLP